MEETSNQYDLEELRRGVARLTGGIGVIYVGGRSPAEVAERKARVEDAIFAAQGAVKEGIVPGGGVALSKMAGASQYVWLDTVPGTGGYYALSHDQQAGARLVWEACFAPLLRLVGNTGGKDSPAYVKARVTQWPDAAMPGGVAAFEDRWWWQGYNALTQQFGDLREWRIFDPTRVVIQALNNAVSAAAMLLTTSTSIVELPESGQGQA
jgi:chaperonin GroEL